MAEGAFGLLHETSVARRPGGSGEDEPHGQAGHEVAHGLTHEGSAGHQAAKPLVAGGHRVDDALVVDGDPAGKHEPVSAAGHGAATRDDGQAPAAHDLGPKSAGPLGEGQHAKPAGGPTGSAAAAATDDEGWFDDETRAATPRAPVPASAKAAAAPVDDEGWGTDETRRAAPATAPKHETEAEHDHHDAGAAHGAGELADHVERVRAELEEHGDSPLPVHEETHAAPPPSAILRGDVASRPQPGKSHDPRAEAHHADARLEAEGEREIQGIVDAQQAKAREFATAAQARLGEKDGYSAVAEEKAKAKARQAQAHASQPTATAQGGHEVTLDSLKADLARALEQETAELSGQNDKAHQDVHERFEARRAELRARADAGAAGRAAALAAAQKQALQSGIASRKDELAAQVIAQKQRLDGSAVEKQQQLAQAAVAEGHKLTADAETQARQTIAKGEADAAQVKERAKREAEQATLAGTVEAGKLRISAVGHAAQAGDKAKEELEDVEVRCTMMLDTARDAAKKIEHKGDDSAGKIKLEAERAAAQLRGEGKQLAERAAAQAKAGAAAVDHKVSEAAAAQDHDAQVAAAKLDGTLAKLTADTDKAMEKPAAKLAAALTKLTEDEDAALAKLDAQLEKRLAAVHKKGDAAQKRLEAGKEKDLRSLAKMVKETSASIDRSSVEAAQQIDALRKQVMRKAQAAIAQQLRKIAAAGQAAAAATRAAVSVARKQVHIEAEAAQRQLELDGRQGMDSVEKEAAAQAIAQEAAARKSEAFLAAEGEKKQGELDKRLEVTEAALAGMSADVKTELESVKTMDLAVAKDAAKALEKAMDRWGTDEEGVFKALRMARSPAEMRAIKAAYKARTGHDLDADLDDELKGSELREAKALESGDPVRIAVARLESSQGGFVSGADTTKIQETLDGIKDPQVKAQVAREYQRTTGKRLSTMLKDELGEEALAKAQQSLADMPPLDDHLKVDPDKMKDVDRKAMREAAAELRRAMDGIGTKEDAIHQALKGKTPEQIETIKELYRQHYHVELIDQLEKEMSGTDLKEATAALSGNQVDAAVASLENAMDGAGTEEEKIHDVLEGIEDPEQRRQVIDEFERQTGRQLSVALHSEMDGADAEIADTLMIADNAERRRKVGAIRLDEAAKGAGTDEDAINRVLENARDPEERKAIAEEYERRTGRTLASMLESELDGTDRDLATALSTGDEGGAAAARVQAATQGFWGTSEKGIFAQLEGKSPEERQKLREAYNRLYGKDSPSHGPDFEAMLGSTMSGMDYQKAQYLNDTGTVPPDFALEYAMAGRGTDEDGIKHVLAGKTPAQVQAIRDAYWLKYHKDLDVELHGELSGRDDFEVGLLLEGEPQDAAGKLEREKKKYVYERGGGEGSTSIGAGVTDLFSDAGEDLDRSHEEMLALERELKAKGVVRVGPDGKLEMVPGAHLDAEAEQKLDESYDWNRLDVKSYQEAKDSVTEGVAEVAGIVAGGIVTIATAGAAAPLVAALAALASGGTSMLVKAAMQGGAYGIEDMGIDAGKTLLQAATAGAMKSGFVLKKVEKLAKIMTGPGGALARKLVTDALHGAAASALSSMTVAAFDGANAGDVGDWLHGVFAAGGTGALSGAVGGLLGKVKYAPGQGLVGEAMPAASSLAGAGWRGVVSGLTGGVAPLAVSGLWDPSIFSGRGEDIFGRFARNGITSAAQAGFDAMGDFRHTSIHMAAHDGGGGGGGGGEDPHRAPTARYSQVDTVVDAPAFAHGEAGASGEHLPWHLPAVDAHGVPLPAHPAPPVSAAPPPVPELAPLRALEAAGVPRSTFQKGEASEISVHPPWALPAVDEHGAPYQRRAAIHDVVDRHGLALNELHDPMAEPPVHETPSVDGVAQETLMVPHDSLPQRTGRTLPMGAPEPSLHEQTGGRELSVMKPLEGPARPGPDPDAHPPRPSLRPSEEETAVWAPPVVEMDGVDGVAQERLVLPHETTSPGFIHPAPAPGRGGSKGPTAAQQTHAEQAYRMRVAQQAAADPHSAPERLPFGTYGTRDAMQVVSKLPGTGHIKGVMPDHFPPTKGWLRLSDAQKLIHTYDHLALTPTGQATLRHIADRNIEVTMERGKGSFQRSRVLWMKERINLDPLMEPDAHNLAGTAAHEGYHSATADRDANVYKQSRDQYVNALLRNEAEAEAVLLDHHREVAAKLGIDRSPAQGGYQTYHDAYEQVLRDHADTGEPAEVVHGRAREAGIRKLQEMFATARPGSSLMVHAASGRLMNNPNAPKDYTELYGKQWDGALVYRALGSKLAGLFRGTKRSAMAPEIDPWGAPQHQSAATHATIQMPAYAPQGQQAYGQSWSPPPPVAPAYYHDPAHAAMPMQAYQPQGQQAYGHQAYPQAPAYAAMPMQAYSPHAYPQAPAYAAMPMQAYDPHAYGQAWPAQAPAHVAAPSYAEHGAGPFPTARLHADGAAAAERQPFAIHDRRAAREIINGLPGGAHYDGIIPDDWPPVPGCIRESDAQAMIHTYDAMATTQTGQNALRMLADHGVMVTMDRGAGHFRNPGPPPRINLDPSRAPDAHFLAEMATYEAYQAAGLHTGAPRPTPTYKSSASGLDEFIDRVWGQQHALGKSDDAYNLYAMVDPKNPNARFTGDEQEYIAALRELGKGRRGLSNVQDNEEDGFWRFESTYRDWSKVKERVYVNVQADHAAEVMKMVVQGIVDNPSMRGIHMAKLSGPRAVADRPDSIVLYCEDEAAASAAVQRIRQYQEQHPEHFNFTTPLMTNQVADGISTAAAPEDRGASFGDMRAIPVYRALERARAAGAGPEEFRRMAAEELMAAGIDPQNPHQKEQRRW